VSVPGVLGWIFAKQAEFYRQFSALIRASKADGSAAWSLLGRSVGNIGHDSVNHLIGTSDEGFPHQPACRIVEDPHAVVLVRANDVDGVSHGSHL